MSDTSSKQTCHGSLLDPRAQPTPESLTHVTPVTLEEEDIFDVEDSDDDNETPFSQLCVTNGILR